MQKNPFDPGYYHSEELRGMGFAAVGEQVSIAKNCTLIGLHNISLGDHVRIDGNTTIAAAKGKVTLGSYIHIGGGGFLLGGGGITLEDFTTLSQGVKVYGASDDYSGEAMTNPMVPAEYLNVKHAPVVIKRHGIVGSGSVILPGCTLGEGVAVGALTVVTRDLDAWGIYAGSPAKRLRERSRALLEKEQAFINSGKGPAS